MPPPIHCVHARGRRATSATSVKPTSSPPLTGWPAAIPIQISAQALDTVSGYTGFYIGGPATLSVLTLAPLQISAESQVATRRALWNKGGLIVPGALSITTAAGMVADDTTFGGYFHIGGATSMTAAGAGNTVSLVNAGNAFSGAVAVTAADTTLRNSAALNFGASNIGGALTVTAPGISQSGAVSVSGASTLNSGSSAITLANGANAFGGAMSLTAGNATVAANAPLTFGATTLTGSLNASAPGLLQTGTLSVAGTTTLNSGSSTITRSGDRPDSPSATFRTICDTVRPRPMPANLPTTRDFGSPDRRGARAAQSRDLVAVEGCCEYGTFHGQ